MFVGAAFDFKSRSFELMPKLEDKLNKLKREIPNEVILTKFGTLIFLTFDFH